MPLLPLFATAGAILALLFLVLKVRLPAFLSLILISIVFGLTVGMDPSAVIEAVRNGMGGTLGFVAVVVGLGAMMGALLEASGGVEAISNSLLKKFGPDRAPTALTLIGFLVSIPVFFDVALIILLPLLLGLSERTGKSILAFAIPLTAGMVVTHSFVPPTPGPIAVAEILSADLGWIILFGIIAGLPAAFIAGPMLASQLVKLRSLQNITPPDLTPADEIARPSNPAGFSEAMFIIIAPVTLILIATVTKAVSPDWIPPQAMSIIGFVGHPFTALLIACLLAWWLLGLRHGLPAENLREACARALEPAGLVVLVTGAGGAFKQILVDSGTGTLLAETLLANDMPLLLFGFLSAFIVRVSQGSATVAMITGAGLCAPVAELAGVTGPTLGLLVIAIASGASMTSHVNDSGFWLVSRYLGLSEAQTLKSWTVMTTIIGLVGFGMACLLSLVF
ncbi:GntP family permease [Parvularcula marina]|uniref:GntP family permease n=1 Tax=Parvularcula marina TaxID=2292771 RepID=UPI0035120D7B